MGLLNACAELLVKEHALRPIGPDVLFIGRQLVPLSLDTLNRLLARYGLKNQAPDCAEYDNETRGAAGHGFITDRYFLKALGVKTFHALDVTDYEGAEIIHDMGLPIPEKYYGKYDFVYNGSCLDNMFNPGVAMINISKLLKPKGRSVNIESASSRNSPYIMFSPGWFYDYYVVNKYKRAHIYLAAINNNDELHYGPWDMYYVNVRADRNGPPPNPEKDIQYALLTVAEKGEASTDEVQPVQYQYRTTPDLRDEYEKNEAVLMQESCSGLIHNHHVDPTIAPYLNYVGKFGVDLRPDGAPSMLQPEDPLIVRVIGLLDVSSKTAEFLSSLVRIARPIAGRIPPVRSFLDGVDEGANRMWNRLKAEKGLHRGAEGSGPSISIITKTPPTLG